jgi:ubiquinone/menaquinone biosynthesis C-methylase UbiE
MIKKTPGRAAFRKSFNRVAALYDKWRPGYPEELFAEIGKITGLGRGSRVLEVGCGTGKATTGMAKCGADMLCIDIGPAMLEIAKKNCSKFGNVKFRRSSF